MAIRHVVLAGLVFAAGAVHAAPARADDFGWQLILNSRDFVWRERQPFVREVFRDVVYARPEPRVYYYEPARHYGPPGHHKHKHRGHGHHGHDDHSHDRDDDDWHRHGSWRD